MNIEHINIFLNELGRCEMSEYQPELLVENHTYNGLKGSQGSEYYYQYLEGLCNSFINEIQPLILDLDRSKLYILSVYDRVKELSAMYFDTPTKETINSQKKDYKGFDFKFKNELDRMSFFRQMNDVQLYFIYKTKLFLEKIIFPLEGSKANTLPPKSNDVFEEAINSFKIDVNPPQSEDSKYLYGYKQLEDFLKIGHNKATDMVLSGKYNDAIIRNGRGYMFIKDKLIDLMSKHTQKDFNRAKRPKK